MESSARRWARLERLFHGALDLPEARRSAYLDRECSEPALRADLEALLASDRRTTDPLATAIDDLLLPSGDSSTPTSTEASEDSVLGQKGPYRLLEKIGQGGLGTVYLAERVDGQFQRQVAIKVVRRGLMSEGLIEDLRSERQILAHLEHPNIARLYDGGTDSRGRPFLTMEYVDGLAIDLFCRTLPQEKRLSLFLDVCSAVSYAHRNLIIHRDIKPSNILVSAEGIAKLLDFGIASPVTAGRSIRHNDPEPSLNPLAGQDPRPAFTPDYASPEQAAGEPLTTATDIYSIGVVLYRLISGQPPYLLGSTADPETIAESLRTSPVEPPSIAARKAGQPTWKTLRGDLDAIVGKAMSVQPQQRYGSVQELADDIRNHLQNRPVAARANRWSYRASKFLRRHRAAVSAATVMLGALAFGLLATLQSQQQAQAARITAERHLADLTREQKRSDRMIESFVDTFRLADPGEARGETITVRELIDRSVQGMTTAQSVDPELSARLALTFGKVYLNLGSPGQAQELFERSLTYFEPHLSADHSIPWQARSLVAETLVDQGKSDQAVEQLEQDLLRYHREVGTNGIGLARLTHTLGVAKLHLDDPKTAAQLFRQAISLYDDTLDSRVTQGSTATSSLEVAESHHRLAQALLRLGELEDAEQRLQQVLEFRRHELGSTHPSTVTALGDLAALALYRGRDEQAAELYEQVLARHRTVFGSHHPHVAVALQNLATAEKHLGRLDSAKQHLVEAVALRRQLHHEAHPAVADALYALARFVHQQRNFDEAELLYQQVLEQRRLSLGDQHPRVALALLGLADVEWSRGQLQNAEQLYRQVIARLEASSSHRTVDASFAYYQLGLLLLRDHRWQEAAERLSTALQLMQQYLGVDHPTTAKAREALAQCRDRLSDPAASEAGRADTGDQ